MVPQRFYEGLKGFHKTFWGTTKKRENKNLTLFFLFARDRDGRVKWIFAWGYYSRFNSLKGATKL